MIIKSSYFNYKYFLKIYLSHLDLLSKLRWKIPSEKEMLMLYKQQNFFVSWQPLKLVYSGCFFLDVMRSIEVN